MMNLKNLLKRIFLPAPAAKGPIRTYQHAIASKDYAAAAPLLKEACGRGDVDAMTLLASLYSSGWGLEQDFEEAALWYRQAAIGGNPDAQAALGSMLAEGDGVAVNLNESAYWLYRSARSGHEDALNWLADLTLQVPDVVGEHFDWSDLTELLKTRGKNMMLASAG